MISVLEAENLLSALIPPPAFESVPLNHAVGRVLAHDVVADRDGPPFDRVAMDGVALSWADWSQDRRTFAVTGFQAAGRPSLVRVGKSTAIEVATGAVLPNNCDTVVPYEEFCAPGAPLRVEGPVTLKTPPTAGRNVHRRGSDYLAGSVLLEAQTLLTSAALHVPASVGLAQVEVVRRARWALASTGDELVDVRSLPLDYQIRSSNLVSISGEARSWNLAPEESSLLPDDPARLRDGLARLTDQRDVLVLSGGVSAGRLDLVPSVLAELGAREVFHKVRQRPGKPLWCGVLPNDCVVFGLPGNPVSSLFSFRRYVVPLLLRWEARTPFVPHVVVRGAYERSLDSENTYFLPVRRGFTGGQHSAEYVEAMAYEGSGNFHQLATSAGFVQIDKESGSQRDFPVPFFAWGLPGGAP